MATEQSNDRWQEIKSIHRDYRFFYEMAAGIAFVIIGIIVGFALFPNDIGYRGNLYTTILGVVITILVLDRRAEQRTEQTNKARLIQQMSSRSNAFALDAVEQLRYHSWLKDGSLKDCVFQKADLQNAFLRSANLRNTHIIRSNLANADLSGADLRGAYLYESNLQSSWLEITNLKAEFDVKTMLPDGTYWTPETDMRRFTDPTHPDFWRSGDPSSPAYRGKERG